MPPSIARIRDRPSVHPSVARTRDGRLFSPPVIRFSTCTILLLLERAVLATTTHLSSQTTPPLSKMQEGGFFALITASPHPPCFTRKQYGGAFLSSPPTSRPLTRDGRSILATSTHEMQDGFFFLPLDVHPLLLGCAYHPFVTRTETPLREAQ